MTIVTQIHVGIDFSFTDNVKKSDGIGIAKKAVPPSFHSFFSGGMVPITLARDKG